MKKFVLGLFLILLVSGCAGMPFDLGNWIPGWGGGSKVNKTEASPDLIIIQNINTLPSPPVSAGDSFSVSFEMKNQDELKDVATTYELFDWGLCTQPTGSDSPVTVTLSPLGTEFKEWTFGTPPSAQLGGLSITCPIRFKISYSFDAKSQIDVNVIDMGRFYEMQRSGQTPSFVPQLNIGRGPIKVYITFGGTLPVRNSSSLPVFITVEDKGAGLLGTIGSGKLGITFPSGFTVTTGSCGNKFNCTGLTCTSNQDIPLIRKKSSQMGCTVTTPNSVALDNLEKTYYIFSSLNYTYELTGESSVEVKPILT